MKISYVGLSAGSSISIHQSQWRSTSGDPSGKDRQDLLKWWSKAVKTPMSIRGDHHRMTPANSGVALAHPWRDSASLPSIGSDRTVGSPPKGQAVTRVTVDGKHFFVMTRAIPPRTCRLKESRKYGVFDEQSEEEKRRKPGLRHTSRKDHEPQAQDEFKKGGFGKIIAGGRHRARRTQGNFNQVQRRNGFPSSASATIPAETAELG